MTGRVCRGAAWRAPQRALAIAAAAAAISACHPPQTHSPQMRLTPPPPTGSTRVLELQHTIDRALADPAIGHGTWGVLAKSLTTGDVLYTLNAGKLLTPASSMKTLTLAIAADRLGWDYPFLTRVLMAGTVTDGTLDGDLVIIGSGDPTIENWRGNTWLDTWPELLRRQGIRRINGRIVGDDSAFDDEGLGAGWTWEDLAASYSAPASGLQFNQNSVQLVVTPGATLNDRPIVEMHPPWAPLAFVNLLTTTAARTASTLTVQTIARAPVIELRGTVAAGSPSTTRTVAVSNPTLYFAEAARDALVRGGIEVIGPAADADDIVRNPEQPPATPLTEFSTSLAAIARPMMKLSPNLFAESLLKTLGAQTSSPGTTEAGRTLERTALGRWGIAASDVLIADGSGLSRYNLITPGAMVDILTHVYRDDRLRDTFMDLLPVAGVDGTLSARMKNTAAAANVRGKTGTFSNARALVGYVRTKDNEPLVFAILTNNYNVDAGLVDRATDAIVIALAGFSRK